MWERIATRTLKTEIFHFVCANRVRCRNSGNARRPPLRAAKVLNRIPGLLGVPITFFGTSHNMIKNRDNPGFPGRLVTLPYRDPEKYEAHYIDSCRR
ncbi:hypothetical protein J6590_051643 [Homalodisca vitripennis]|nr:hypothetical protein J6590_051643 [Homalodisca vitripennis]